MSTLEKLLEDFVKEGTSGEQFYAVLLSSEVFALSGDEPIDGGQRKILDAETEIQLVNGEMDDGTNFVPIFTSLEELQKSINEEMNYIGMEGWNMLHMVKDTNVVINPNSEYGIHLTPENIAEIIQFFGASQFTVEEETPVLIGRMAEDPTELKNVVKEVFARDPRVKTAHLALLVNEKTQEKSIVIAVDFAEGQEYPEIFKIAGSAAQPHIPQGHYLDFVVVNDDDGVSATIVSDGDRFYTA
ncbi:MAG TPA: hypothetical protein EYG18_07080 [Micavibrio sp.]|nr:hypothetical protein [Micavibrio sp.]HIL29015.1 hypothetical protein [Micavibrio sp.]